MLFNSFTFMVFFATVFLFYYLLPHKFRWILLLGASLIFYMWWKAELIILIIVSAVNNHSLSLLINKTERLNKKKLFLAVNLIINFVMLFVFKYLVFANDAISYFTGKPVIENFNIILPMGISFYTFQSAAYTIDVYKNKIKPQKNFLKFLLFIIFFPQLVAGPIERSTNLMPQLFSVKKFNTENIVWGFKIALFGFFKKIVIADRAALFVNGIFNSVQYYGFVAYVIAVFLFAFQIYCDFSGYSDIAIGCSKMLGIDLMKNFDRPYLAYSLKNFWRRWHISLSTWFKDYLYFPLGGNKVSKFRNYFNIIITFTISGLWHGANWTFIVWGLLHGFLQTIGIIKSDLIKQKSFEYRNPISKFFSIIITFSITSFLFLFFRANTISDALYMIRHFFWGFRDSLTPQGFYTAITTLPASVFELIIVFCAILFLMVIEILEKEDSIHELLNKKNIIIKFLFYYIITITIFALGVFSSGSQFIYFQF